MTRSKAHYTESAKCNGYKNVVSLGHLHRHNCLRMHICATFFTYKNVGKIKHVHVAQLSQRDRAAGQVSFGQK